MHEITLITIRYVRDIFTTNSISGGKKSGTVNTPIIIISTQNAANSTCPASHEYTKKSRHRNSTAVTGHDDNA
jgi:hypothetical protein